MLRVIGSFAALRMTPPRVISSGGIRFLVDAGATVKGSNALRRYLLARDCHAVDPDRRARDRSADLEIAADGGHVVKHVAKIPGDGDLFHWVSKLAVRNPDAARAAGEISGNEVYAKPEEFGQIQTLFDFAKNVLRRTGARFKVEVSGTDARIAGETS